MKDRKAKVFYKKGNVFGVLRPLVEGRLGNEAADYIWERAGENLSVLMDEYKGAPKGEHVHLDNIILPRVAMYRAMTEKLSGNESVALIEEAVRIGGTEIGKKIDRFTSLPFMSGFFVKMFGIMGKKMFGENNGFKNVFYSSTRKLLRFDIVECPYCKYSRLCGAPELTKAFCDSDVYCYGNLKKVKFERTQTLGTGGSCCDFKLARVK